MARLRGGVKTVSGAQKAERCREPRSLPRADRARPERPRRWWVDESARPGVAGARTFRFGDVMSCGTAPSVASVRGPSLLKRVFALGRARVSPLRRAIASRMRPLVKKLALRAFGQPPQRQARAREVAAEVLQSVSSVSWECHIGVQGEALQASTTRFLHVLDGGRRAQTAHGMTGPRTAGHKLLDGGRRVAGQERHLLGDGIGRARLLGQATSTSLESTHPVVNLLQYLADLLVRGPGAGHETPGPLSAWAKGTHRRARGSADEEPLVARTPEGAAGRPPGGGMLGDAARRRDPSRSCAGSRPTEWSSSWRVLRTTTARCWRPTTLSRCRRSTCSSASGRRLQQ